MIPLRVLVTGSRGKSTVTRLIHRALVACGFRAYGRITGVVPRTLTPGGERPILRGRRAHVQEMAWWLDELPSDAQAVVMENSAVSGELQPLAARWLRPTVTVLTNVRPDHQDVWGPGRSGAADALCRGIPFGGTVVWAEEAARCLPLRVFLQDRQCDLTIARPVEGMASHLAVNAGLALEVCRLSGLDDVSVLPALRSLPPDVADFSVLRVGDGQLAFGFSANDVMTTQELFESLSWPREDVTVLFNHRGDRPQRLREFLPWIGDERWKERLVVGDRPFVVGAPSYRPLRSEWDLADLISRSGRVFGCGNVVHGFPLLLRLSCL